MAIETLSEQRCYDGVQGFYTHPSAATGTAMRFAVYQPPQATQAPVPALIWLAGLTCTEETATIKAGLQRLAAIHGLCLVMPDTSPRGTDLPGEHDDWDFGSGAGFYIDATAAPWSAHYRMESYISGELFELLPAQFPIRGDAVGITGHSMGGHGALTLALKHPEKFVSVSAFAPICAPTRCPWGEKAFSRYLGGDRPAWAGHDACALLQAGRRCRKILVDQGLDDQFLDAQLHPHLLEAACAEAGQPLELHRRPGYDHSYYFIQSFAPDHVEHHAAQLWRA